MRTEATTIAADIPKFLSLLKETPWFLHLGKPHPNDDDVVRIHSWSEWPGPEGDYGDWFGTGLACLREQMEKEEEKRREELASLWEQIEPMVLDRASKNVPDYEPERDSWYGPTVCVWQAAYLASLVGWHVLLRRAMGWMIADQWTWFLRGHWPCGFAEATEDFDGRFVETSRVKLLVL